MKILENWGLYHINRYLNANNHLFSRLSLQQVTKIAIGISFVVGFLITLMVVIADILFFAELSQVLASARLLLFFVLLNIGLIVIEFWLLFHIGFQIVARYILILEKHYPVDQTLKKSLVRAVLELNEPYIKRFGLNPYRHLNKHSWLKILLYKTKVILSNFIAKLIARKVLSRVGLRAYAPLISTLITGWWDAWIQKAVLTEVRFRLSGRLYAVRLLDAVHSASPRQDWLEVLIRLVAVRIELFGTYNINLDYLITRLDRSLVVSTSELADLFDIERLQALYSRLPRIEQDKLAEIACLLIAFKQSKLSKQESDLLLFFNVDHESFKQTKQQFNQLFYYKIDDVLVEI